MNWRNRDWPRTILSLTGAQIPEQMQGHVFLGSDKEPSPKTVHFFRDRMGDCYDFSRAVTDGRYYYVRNFMPHRPRGRDTRYGYTVQSNWGPGRSITRREEHDLGRRRTRPQHLLLAGQNRTGSEPGIHGEHRHVRNHRKTDWLNDQRRAGHRFA